MRTLNSNTELVQDQRVSKTQEPNSKLLGVLSNAGHVSDHLLEDPYFLE